MDICTVSHCGHSWIYIIYTYTVSQNWVFLFIQPACEVGSESYFIFCLGKIDLIHPVKWRWIVLLGAVWVKVDCFTRRCLGQGGLFYTARSGSSWIVLLGAVWVKVDCLTWRCLGQGGIFYSALSGSWWIFLLSAVWVKLDFFTRRCLGQGGFFYSALSGSRWIGIVGHWVSMIFLNLKIAEKCLQNLKASPLKD